MILVALATNNARNSGQRYTHHGTVKLLLFLIVHTGRMEVAVQATKDAKHYIRQLRAFRRRRPALKGVFLIQDRDPSHTSGDTAAYWSSCRGWWRPRFTPAHASWLNQAELLVGDVRPPPPEVVVLGRPGPTSVSPGEPAISQACRGSKSNQKLPVRKAGKSVAKEWPFFVQRMGSTSCRTVSAPYIGHLTSG